MILLDTSGLFAALVSDQPGHASTRRALASQRRPGLLSPFVLAELAYLLASRGGVDAELALLREVARGAYELVSFLQADVGRAAAVVEQYRDLGIGLTDASLVVLAARYRTKRLLTLDERHFRAVRPLDGGEFELLPADA